MKCCPPYASKEIDEQIPTNLIMRQPLTGSILLLTSQHNASEQVSAALLELSLLRKLLLFRGDLGVHEALKLAERKVDFL